MKRSLLTFIFGLMILINPAQIFLFAADKPTETGEKVTPTTVYSCDTSQPARKISPTFYGICHPRINSYDKPEADQQELDLLPLIRELEPQILRGPAGTGANYWLWQEGRHMTPQSPDFDKFYGHAPRVVSGHTNHPTNPLTLDRLFATPDTLNLPYVFCTNTISQTHDQNVALAVALANHFGSRGSYLELGNELYANSYAKAYPRASDYFKQARQLYMAIKQASPQTHVSVMAFNPVLLQRIVRDPNNLRKTDKEDWEFTVAGRCQTWQDAVIHNSDVGDAVTIHYYDRCRNMDRFTTQSQVMDHFFNEAQLFTDKMNELIPRLANRKVWITEWNLMIPELNAEKNQDQKARLQLLKSLGSGLVAADLLCRMLDEPAITVTSFHSLMSGNGFGILQRDLPRSQKIVRMPVFYMLKAFGHALKDNPYTYAASLKQGPVRSDHPQGLKQTTVKVADASCTLMGDAKQPRVALWINRTDEPRTVELDGHSMQLTWQYGGDAKPMGKFPQATLKRWNYAPANVPEPITFETAASVQTLTLPPYSFSITALK